MHLMAGKLRQLSHTIPRVAHVRSIVLNRAVWSAVDSNQWSEVDRYRLGSLRGELDRFIGGERVSVMLFPRQKPPTTYLKRLKPVADEVWEIRCCGPAEGVRVLDFLRKINLLGWPGIFVSARHGKPCAGSVLTSGESCFPAMERMMDGQQLSTSATHFLSKPVGREPVDPAALGYMRQRNRGRVYSAVIDEFDKSGITQTDLAARLGKGTDQISRWLGSPGNWTLDTVSDLFFAISGGEPVYNVQRPLELPVTKESSLEFTTPVAYGEALPHDSSYIRGTISPPTCTMPTAVNFQGSGSSSVATPIGPVPATVTTLVGSNASIGGMGSIFLSNGTLTNGCANSAFYGASADAGTSLLGSWVGHSSSEFSLNLATGPNVYQEIVALMTPTYQVDNFYCNGINRVSALR